MSAPPMVTRSSGERRRTAEITPTGIPTRSHTTSAPAVSEIVAGRRAKICDLTETSFWYE